MPITSQFRELLRKRTGKLGYTRKDLSLKLNRSVEHVRKLLAGEAFPGPDLQERIAEVLRVDHETLDKAVKRDRWSKKYGNPPSATVVERVSPMGEMWDQLSSDQREDLVCFVQCMIRKNRKKVRLLKPNSTI